MGFYNLNQLRKTNVDKVNADLVEKYGCEVCGLSSNLHSPKMEPTGSANPVIYILGTSPSETEDKEGYQFCGKAGKYLRPKLRLAFGHNFVRQKVRWNNVVRCRPIEGKKNREPKPLEILACKSSIVEDIEKTKPKIIMGFGSIPLEWVSGRKDRAMLWRGRRLPVKVGSHVCWYFSMSATDFVLSTKFGNVLRKKSSYWFDKNDHCFTLDFIKLKNFLDNYEEPEFVDTATLFDNITHIDDFDILETKLNELAKEEYVAIDIENYPLRPYHDAAKILCVSVSNENETISFPFKPEFKYLFWDFLITSGRKIVQNLSHELEWFTLLFDKSIVFDTKWECTMRQAFVLDERKDEKSKRGLRALNDLSLLHFGFELKKYSDIHYRDVLNTPMPDLLRSCGLDSKWTYKLFFKQQKLLEKDNLVHVYEKNIGSCKGLTLTSVKGLHIDFDVVEKQHKMFESEYNASVEEIKGLPEVVVFEKQTGRLFNPRSENKDLPELLIDQMKLEKIASKNKRGYSLDVTALEQYSSQGVRIAELILQNRERGDLLGKFGLSNYGLTGKFIHNDTLVHANFLDAHAETGRVSARNPNPQNIDKHRHKYVRERFIAPEGYMFVAVDYGQIQVRFIGIESDDKVLIDYCASGHDFHMEFAELIATAYPTRIGGKRYLTDKEVMKDFRQDVKSEFVFAKFFGSTDAACAARLKVPVDIIARITDKYLWKQFSGVKEWQTRVLKFYKENGYVVSKFGRRRRAPLTINQQINSSIQALEVEVVNSALYRLAELAYILGKPQIQPVIQIHDDLSFYLPIVSMEDDVEFISKEMVRIPPEFEFIVLPLTVEVEIGDNWGKMQPIAEFSTTDFDY